MAKLKVYVNIGHSDTDPGAVKYEVERELNVKVANFMRDYLLANYDCEVRMNPGTMGNLNEICEDANSWGADLFVSIHFNAGGGDGFEVLVYSKKRIELGQVFEKHVLAIGQNSRGVKIRTDLAVLKGTDMPAVLNEGAFVDNKKDIQDWDEDHELKKMGEAYAKAAAEYLSLPKKKAAEPKPESTTSKVTTAKVELKILKKGSKNNQVKTLQRILYAMKYNLGDNPMDGDFGKKTDAAVRHFQRTNKLDETGIVDAKTWGKLLKG